MLYYNENVHTRPAQNKVVFVDFLMHLSIDILGPENCSGSEKKNEVFVELLN